VVSLVNFWKKWYPWDPIRLMGKKCLLLSVNYLETAVKIPVRYAIKSWGGSCNNVQVWPRDKHSCAYLYHVRGPRFIPGFWHGCRGAKSGMFGVRWDVKSCLHCFFYLRQITLLWLPILLIKTLTPWGLMLTQGWDTEIAPKPLRLSIPYWHDHSLYNVTCSSYHQPVLCRPRSRPGQEALFQHIRLQNHTIFELF
jgi:hypothetical protein